MIYYLVLYVVSISFLVISSRYKLDFFYFFSVLVVAIFASLREGVGVDYQEYSDLFPLVVSGLNNQFEVVNNIIIKIFYNFGGEHAVFGFYSIVTIFLISYSFKVLSLSKEVSFLIFLLVTVFYLATFNHIRQWLAISLIMFGYALYIKGYRISSVVAIFLAPLVHLSVVLLSLLLLLFKFNIKERVINLLIIAGVPVGIIGYKFLEFTKYRIYLDDFGGFYLPYLMIFILSIIEIYLFQSVRDKIDKRKYGVLYSLLLMLSGVSFLVTYIGPPLLHGMRFIESIFWVEMVVLPYIFILFDKTTRFLFIFTFLLLILTYNVVVLAQNGNVYKLTPFETFLM
ncbi:EpsG family protein [Vibrio sp. LQ2]|uniref:EpsG family protein n=1 Tax=Vibrio TaxID=662 RepID=UPI001F3B62D7|nr:MULTISPECIES: EpsG family protein [Vibrio]MCE7622163.1 EpsG family protein [Vibrio fluvialis]UPO64775.1 O-antigen polymerase [Vibrio fluvialis]USP05273.1 EpsG family protein [Vibrio sp. LQ2]